MDDRYAGDRVYNKLVRDKILGRIRADGRIPYTHIARGSELEQALWNKLDEEVKEFQQNPVVEELADVLEVINTLIRHNK